MKESDMEMQNTIEEKIRSTDRRVKEILADVEKTNAELDMILAELGTTPDKLENYFDDPTQFSASEWEEIDAEKKRLDDQLDCALENVRDPVQAKKKYAENGDVQRHWLFVR